MKAKYLIIKHMYYNLNAIKMKLRVILLIWAIALIGAIATKHTLSGSTIGSENKMSLNVTADDMAGWSTASKMAAQVMKKKYGEPNERTSSMMIWKNNGPWKKTIIYAYEVQHAFPLQHTDVLQQFVDYKTPTDKFDEVAMFDGSVVCNRTNGEMSARCDKEEANFLALNLANDIITGKRDVQSAREFYAKSVKEMINGGKPEYTQKLLFDATKGNTEDPDESSFIITDEDANKAKKLMETQVKEMKLLQTGMEEKKADN